MVKEREYRATQDLTLIPPTVEGELPKTLVGYASVFDTPYEIEGMVETIDRRAFDRTLREQPDVYALLGHDPNRVIARTLNGSLRLLSDDRGLRVEIDPIDTQDGRDARQLVATGTVNAMSFGFIVAEDTIEVRDGRPHRNITDLHLHEVSIVTWPANPAASVSAQAQQRARDLVAEARRKSRRRFVLPLPPLASLLSKGI